MRRTAKQSFLYGDSNRHRKVCYCCRKLAGFGENKAQLNNSDKVRLEELIVSTLAMADATAKLLIANGLFTDDEFKHS